MQRGYIKIWRRSIDNGWLQNHLLWAFWCWCLLKASHKKTDIMVGYQRVELEPGQLVFGRNNAAKELRASPQNIRTCVDTLRKSQNLTIKSTNKFSIITIINWDSYQHDTNQINQQIDQQPTSNQPATNHKQECKALKNEKNKEKRGRLTRHPLPEDFVLSEDLLAFASKNGINGNVQTVFEQFCDHHRSRGNSMLDWKAAWRTWVRNEIKFGKKSAEPQKSALDHYLESVNANIPS